MGRLTADPELRQTQSGIASCRFTVAVNRKFADKNTGERQADFISCVAWKQTAEFVSRYFSKGSMICVEGELRTGSYQDRNHQDVTHYTTDVNVDNVEFCGSKSDNQNNNQGGNQNQGSYSFAPQQQYAQGQQQGMPYNYNGYQQQPQQNYQQPNQYQQFQQQPQQNQYQQQPMNMSDFEEILSDGGVPF